MPQKGSRRCRTPCINILINLLRRGLESLCTKVSVTRNYSYIDIPGNTRNRHAQVPFAVTRVMPLDGVTEGEVLALAAAVEGRSKGAPLRRQCQPFVIGLSRAALRTIKQNVALSLALKALAVAAVFPGWLTLWLAILGDMGATLLVTANALRLLRVRPDV